MFLLFNCCLFLQSGVAVLVGSGLFYCDICVCWLESVRLCTIWQSHTNCIAWIIFVHILVLAIVVLFSVFCRDEKAKVLDSVIWSVHAPSSFAAMDVQSTLNKLCWVWQEESLYNVKSDYNAFLLCVFSHVLIRLWLSTMIRLHCHTRVLCSPILCN